MEQTEDILTILNQMPCPAFLVKNGVISDANSPAVRCSLEPGCRIEDILDTGAQEYADFQNGCLYLTLNVCGKSCGASVTHRTGFDIFILEQEEDQQELQAMALAAQHLRIPLSNVMTIADRLFPLSNTEDDPLASEQIARINRGLFQMLRIVSNMSDAYRYSQDTAPRMEIRDVGSILEELFRTSAELIRYADIQLQFMNLPEPIYCLVDAEKLERAVSNIISNALKFTPKGGTILARLTQKNKMLYLTVQDSGTSFSGSSLYNQFKRRPGIEDSRFGVGLGMVLVRSAAAAHGGTVLIEQHPEHGTRITMTLAIRQNTNSTVRCSILPVDYAGERDHQLLELADSLPVELYGSERIN